MLIAANIRGLDHWAIVTKDQDRCVAFYEGVFGPKNGPRPQLSFQGVWFYSGETPVVHVISDRPFESGQTGAFDHIAFAMEGSPSEMEKFLNSHRIPSQSG